MNSWILAVLPERSGATVGPAEEVRRHWRHGADLAQRQRRISHQAVQGKISVYIFLFDSRKEGGSKNIHLIVNIHPPQVGGRGGGGETVTYNDRIRIDFREVNRKSSYFNSNFSSYFGIRLKSKQRCPHFFFWKLWISIWKNHCIQIFTS